MLTRQKRPKHQSRWMEIHTIHLIKELLVVAVFSAAQQSVIQVPRAFVKDVLNDETDKARSSNPRVRYRQMVILGPTRSSRSNHRT